MVTLIMVEHLQEVAGVDAVLVALVIVDVLNLMNAVLMAVIVAVEEEEDKEDKVTKAAVVVVEEIKGIGKMVFIILDLVIRAWRKSCLALLKIRKQRIQVSISTSMIISQLKLQVEMYQILLKR